jgi:hypothetical protein
LIPELYYCDKPNGNRINYPEKRDYVLTGISKLIDGYRWAKIVVEDVTREFAFCDLNPVWNIIKTIEPVTIEKIIYKPLKALLDQGADASQSQHSPKGKIDMSPAEGIGVVAIALISIGTLFALIAKPFSNLTDEINELKVLIKELSTNLKNTEKLVSKLDQRLTRAEKKLQSIELNCAKSGHLEDSPSDE